MFNYQIESLRSICESVFGKVCFTRKLLRIYSYIYANFMNEAQCHYNEVHMTEPQRRPLEMEVDIWNAEV